MRRLHDNTMIDRLAAGAMVWVLVVLALCALLLTTVSARAESAPANAGANAADFVLPVRHPVANSLPDVTLANTVTLPAWAARLIEQEDAAAGTFGVQPVSSSDLSIVKDVTTGSEDNSIVFEGEFITYTLTLSNPSSTAATQILLLDVLPGDTLTDVRCDQGCQQVFDEEAIPGPLGDTVWVTITRQISWTIDSLAPGNTEIRQFSARVVGQPDGTVFHNRAFLSYTQDGTSKSGLSNETETTVRVRIEENGLASLSNAATWLSKDFGGTLSLDWGDLDHDGYLDLALGSTVGTAVYRNDRGHLVKFWSNDVQTYGVRWADVDRDGELELVAVGDSLDHTSVTSGTNYVYNRVGNSFVGTTFLSNLQLVRVAPGDFDGDGYVDLVAATNSINASCPVRLFRNTRNPAAPLSGSGECISADATAALGPVDYDNDGRLDLVLGQFPNRTFLAVNSGEYTQPLTITNGVLVDEFAVFLPYDFSWGDYDGDGYLDLAAAFPLERKVRIYHNQAGVGAGLQFFAEIRTSLFRTPLSIDWGDMNGDGRLDLAVADSPLRIYQYTGSGFTAIMSLPTGAVEGEVWSLRVADQDNEGDLDLAVSNRSGPSMLFSNFSPLLSPNMAAIPATGASAASSVAWGDADGDNDLDLLLGAGPGGVATKLYMNDMGLFPASGMASYYASGFGPHQAAFGDVDGDDRLEVVLCLATPAAIQLYDAGNTDSPDWESAEPYYPCHSLAWGDADDDGDLDLLVGFDGPNALYLNDGTGLNPTPTWFSGTSDQTRSVAWGDLDNDRYLDFAVGNYGAPTRIYHNNHDGTFTLAQTFTYYSNTTSVAWADYNGDGYLDLAVGNYGQANLLYTNEGGTLVDVPWSSAAQDKTTSLAWGDWDNDGDPDLAVGNDGEPDRVYENLDSKPGSPPQLYLLWASAESYQTTGVAWGDRDSDGDLDLAISRKGTGQNGVYYNNYVLPSHLTNSFASTMPLPQNPPYVWVKRPGNTAAAYSYSSAELLSGPQNPTVTVQYRLYDPDGTRDDSVVPSDAIGDPIISTTFEFSLDGGATWQPATPMAPQIPLTTTSRLGQRAAFLWDAVADQAISDNARFRITVVPSSVPGPLQRSAISGISPPFRVRGTTCVWPQDPYMVVNKPNPQPGELVRFEGAVVQGSGILTYTWDFGDGTTDQGQMVLHTFSYNGIRRIKMTVRSQPCPIAKEVIATRTLVIGNGMTPVFLPLIVKAAPAAPAALPVAAAPVTAATPQRTAAEDGLPWNGGPEGQTGTGAVRSSEPGASVLPAPLLSAAASPFANSLSKSPALVQITSPGPGAGWQQAGATILSALSPFAITSDVKGVNSQPSVSADGSRVAFWSTANLAPTQNNTDGNPEILIGDIDINQQVTFTQITSSTGNILGGLSLQPSLSGDGLRVVFFSDRDLTGQGLNQDANFEIFMADLTAAVSITQLTRTTVGSNILPAISSDGQHVVFASDRNLVPAVGNTDDNQEIFLLDLASGTFLQLTHTPAGVINDEPAIDADGSVIAFTRDGELMLARVRPDGSVSVEALPNPTGGENHQPAVSGDGSHIAFVSAGDIFVAVVGSGAEVVTTRITSSAGSVINEEPAISADGTRIAYVSGGEIYFYDTQVGLPQKLQGVPHARHPSLSADGTRFAIVSGREIWMAASPRSDVGVVKSSQPDPIVPGAAITYTIVVTNAGPSNAQDLDVTDIIPRAVLTPTWTCAASIGITNCQAGSGYTLTYGLNLYAGGIVTYVVSGTLDPATVADVVNTVVVTVPEDAVDWRPDNNQSTDVRTPFPEADLGVIQGNSPDPAVPGTLLTYVLTVTNGGPSSARDVVLTDTLPAAVVFVSATAPYIPSGPHQVVWNLDRLEPDSPWELTVVVDVPSGVTQTFTNTAIVAGITPDPQPGNNRLDRSTAVAPETDVQLAKMHSPQPVVPGSDLTYTLTISNPGPSDAQNVVVTDTLPGGVQFLSADPLPSSTSSGRVVWNLGILAADTSRHLTVIVHVGSWVTQTLINTAVVTTTSTDRLFDNNSQEDAADVSPEADLSLAKIGDPDPAVPGTDMTYTLAVYNAGLSDAQHVMVTDTLPGEVQFLWANPGPDSVSSGEVVWNLGILPVGETRLLTVSTHILPSVTVPFTNSAVVTSTTDDPDFGNNQAEALTAVSPEVDLLLIKVVNPDPVVPGSDLTYTLTISNPGPSDAQNVVLTDSLPAAVEFVIATGPYTLSGTDEVVWNLGALAAGVSQVQMVTVHVQPWVTQTFTNTAVVTSTTTDANPDDNRADEPARVTPQADVRVLKTHSPDPAIAGEVLTYTLTISNAGLSNAQDVVVTDTLPAEVDLLSATEPYATAGGGGSGSSQVVWSLGPLAVQASRVLTAVVHVQPWVTQPFTNTAAVTTSTGDPDTTNNRADEPVDVETRANLTIAKLDAPDPVVAGATLTYTLLYTNAGPSAAQQVTISDVLPSGVRFAAVLTPAAPFSGPVQAGQVLTWYTATLPAGRSGAITFTVSVTDRVTNILTNTAFITSTTFDDEPAGNVARQRTDILADLALTQTASPLNAVPGQDDVTYLITITNPGPSPVVSATVSDRFPGPGVFAGDTLAWTCASLLGSACGGGSGSVLTDTVTVLLGDRFVYTATGTLDRSASGTLVNTATVTVPAWIVDSNPANNQATTTIVLEPRADLRATKTVDVARPSEGDRIVYTITLINDGPSDAFGVTLTDLLPDGVTLQYQQASSGHYTPGNGEWSLTGKFESGQSATLIITASVDIGTAGRTIVNQVSSLTATRPLDPDSSNNTPAATITVNSPPVANDDGGAGFTTDEDTVLTTASVLANDTDPDVGDILSVAGIDTAATAGLVSDNGDGTFDYDPNGQFEALAVGEWVTDTFTYTVTDGHGLTDIATVAITVNGANDPPTDIGLSNSSVAENEAVGTVVGALSTVDVDTGDTHTYSLVAGAGDTGNGSFTVAGDTLRTAAVLDYETQSSYSIRVRTDDGHGGTYEKQFTIAVTDVNDPPTDIGLSNSSVAENEAVDTVVGTLSTVDADTGDTHTYSLVAGAGDTGNGSFTVAGDTLRTAAVLDYETQSSYSIRVRTDDGHGGTYEKQFAIAVTNVNEPPVANDDGGAGFTTDEDTVLTTASVLTNDTDPDVGDILSVAGFDTAMTAGLVSDNGDGTFDYDPNGQFEALAEGEWVTDTFTYTVTDGHGLTETATVVITINGVDDPPLAVADTATAVRDMPRTIDVVANDTDPDAGDKPRLSVVAVGDPVYGTAGPGAITTTVVYTQAGFSSPDVLTYTVSDGILTDTATVTVTVLPFTVTILGPAAPASGKAATFTATVQVTAALPLTYTWQATGQPTPTVTHPSIAGLTDTVVFTWTGPGPQSITVTAANGEGAVSNTLALAMGSKSSGSGRFLLGHEVWVYLPLVHK